MVIPLKSGEGGGRFGFRKSLNLYSENKYFSEADQKPIKSVNMRTALLPGSKK